LEPKIKKVELEMVTKIWNTKSFDLFPSLQDLSCLFPGGWLDDSIIMDMLSVFLDSLDLNSEIFVLDPVFIQGLPTTKKKSPLDGHKYVFFPYNWKRVHWCLFVLEVSSKNVLVFDSLVKTKNEYRESILCFLYICKHYLGIKDLPSQSVIKNVQPPSNNRSTWSFPTQGSTNRSKFIEQFLVVPSWQQDNNCDCGPFTILCSFYLLSNNLSEGFFSRLFQKEAYVLPQLPMDYMDQVVRKEVFTTIFVMRKRNLEALDASFSDTSFL